MSVFAHAFGEIEEDEMSRCETAKRKISALMRHLRGVEAHNSEGERARKCCNLAGSIAFFSSVFLALRTRAAHIKNDEQRAAIIRLIAARMLSGGGRRPARVFLSASGARLQSHQHALAVDTPQFGKKQKSERAIVHRSCAFYRERALA